MIPYPPLATSTYAGLVQFPLTTSQGGLGADNSAATGIPIFAAGTATVTTATGSGAPVRGTSPTMSGAVLNGQTIHAVGSVSAPSISFAGSGVDGIYSSAFGVVNITANSVEAMRVTGGQCLYKEGSTSSPGFAFIGYGTDGIYHPGSGLVGVVCASTESLRVSSTGIIVSGGSTLKKLLSATASLDFSSIAAGATAELTITVTGAAVGDSVDASPSTSLESGLMAFCYVSATNTVTVRLLNTTGSPVDPAAKTWRATVRGF